MLAMAKQRVQIGVVVAVALVVAVLGAAGPTVSAQSVSDMEQRDRLIADQENLLNTYRCLFGVDVAVATEFVEVCGEFVVVYQFEENGLGLR